MDADTDTDTDTDSDADTDGDADADGDSDADADADGDASGSPVILLLATNTDTLIQSDHESLTFSVVVTDPDGIEDIIGGALEDPEGGTYGAFISSAEEGSYSLSLTWSEIDTTRVIEFPLGGGDRTFRARFFDVAGHETAEDITVGLACGDPARQGACGGTCSDLTRPTDCGSCGHDCSSLADETGVEYASCNPQMVCEVALTSLTRLSCEQVCAGFGLVCTTTDLMRAIYDGYCDGNEGSVDMQNCADTPPANHPVCGDLEFSEMSCDCAEV